MDDGRKHGCQIWRDMKCSVKDRCEASFRGSLMKPKWQKLASLAQEIFTL